MEECHNCGIPVLFDEPGYHIAGGLTANHEMVHSSLCIGCTIKYRALQTLWVQSQKDVMDKITEQLRADMKPEVIFQLW